MNEKTMTIDVMLRRENKIGLHHLQMIISILSQIYPEIKKAHKFIKLLQNYAADGFIPETIKIPIVSSLGIKAIIKVGEIDHKPMDDQELKKIFTDIWREYKDLGRDQE